MSVLINVGDGTFQPSVFYPTGREPRSLAVADLDGKDGVDVVIPSGNDATMAIFLNRGDGTFGPGTVVSTGDRPVSNQSYEDTVVLADLNRDGHADAALTRYVDGSLLIMFGDGHGGFTTATKYPISTANSISSIIADDFNHDGSIDLAVADFSAGVRISYNRGDGSFARSFSMYPTGTNRIASGDLDGNALPDLVAANYESPYLYATVIINRGDGQYSPGQALISDASPRRGAFAVTVAARRQGEPPDVVTANSNGNSVSVFTNRGDGSFGTAASFETGAAPVALAVADLDGNGLADIVTANTDDDSVSVLLRER